MALGQHRAALLLLGLVGLPAVATATPGRGTLTPQAEPSGGTLAARALWFEPNVGQADPSVQFLGRADGFDVLLTSEEIVLSFREPAAPLDSAESQPGERFRRWRDARPVKVRMRFKGGDLANRAVAVDPLEGVSHYLVGADRERWRIGIPHYARVECRDVYPGVNLVLRGNGRRLVYDLVVAPHADPGRIELEFEGGEQLSQGPDGEVLVHTARGRIRHSIPFAYQEGAGGRHHVPAKLTRRGRSGVTYAIAGYDRGRPLVIDPEISYVTTLGGPDSDVAFGVTGDGLGNAYLAGYTSSAGYPTTPGSYQSQRDRPGYLAFVTKLSPAGGVLFSTYLGGSVSDGAFQITLDSGGRIAVGGSTSSADFPIVNGFQGTYLAGFGQSGFVALLSADGAALVYSSFLGGTGESGFGDDVVEAIAADAAGQVYLGGLTNSADFPRRNAAQPALGGFYDAFVMKINADLVGPDSLLYSTYLGGTNTDEVLAMAVDSAGTIHVGGQTGSLDFPTDRPTIRPLQDRSGGGTDGFVARIDPALAPSQQILYSTYIGGEARDRVFGLALDPQGPVYAVGATLSTRFPVTPGARPDPDYTPSPLRNFSDCFFIKLDPRMGGSEGLLYSTYLGGQRADEAAAVAVDDGGNIFIGGTTASPDFPAGRGSTLPGPFVLAWRGSLEPLWEWAQPNQTAYQQVRGMAVTGDGAVYLVGESSPTQQFGGEDVFAIRLAPPQQGRLRVLTSTMRWRPQKAYTKGPDGNPLVSDPLQPIKVFFEGPADIDIATATLEVTPPAGWSTTYGPTLGAKTETTIEGQTPPDGMKFYLVEWRGPWKAGSDWLPAGDYAIKVLAKRQDSQDVLESASYKDVSLVEVTSVELRGLDGEALAVDPPMPLNADERAASVKRAEREGGGLRIFAESTVPGGPVDDRVAVEVKTNPAVDVAVPVYLRALDVADPDAPPPGAGEEIHDNLGHGDLPATIEVPANTNAASTLFRTSHQPGDNFRVLASTWQPWLSEARAVPGSLNGEVQDGDGNDLLEFTGGTVSQLSKMLTVWRTLHLEIDSMAPEPTDPSHPERNFIEGQVKEIQGYRDGVIRLVLEPEPAAPPDMDGLRDGSLDADTIPKGDGRFERGHLRIGTGTGAGGAQEFPVGANGWKYVEAAHIEHGGQYDVRFFLYGTDLEQPICSGSVIDGTPPAGAFDLLPIAPPGCWSDARTGAMWLSVSGAFYPVRDVGPLWLNDDLVQVGTVKVGGDGKLPFHLRDDDEASAPFGVDTSLLQDSDDPNENVLGPAYVRPRLLVPGGPEGFTDAKTARFVRNIECPPIARSRCDTDGAISELDAGRENGFRDTPTFWAMFLQGGFQGSAELDDDPDFEHLGLDSPTLGETFGGRLAFGALVYAEPLRELAARFSSNAARCTVGVPPHELAHQFGINHDKDDPGLMGPCGDGMGAYFLPAQLRTIREKGAIR